MFLETSVEKVIYFLNYPYNQNTINIIKQSLADVEQVGVLDPVERVEGILTRLEELETEIYETAPEASYLKVDEIEYMNGGASRGLLAEKKRLVNRLSKYLNLLPNPIHSEDSTAALERS